MAAGGGGAWKVAYADFVTAMMAFFMVMWLTAQKPDVKEAVAAHFRGEDLFNMDEMDPNSETPSSGGGVKKSHSGKMQGKGNGKSISPTDDPNAPESKKPKVLYFRNGEISSIGTIAYFEGTSLELNEDARKHLDYFAPQAAGKPNKVEIRGHAMRQSEAGTDPWKLSYERSIVVMRYLENKGLSPKQVRLSQAGPNEPFTIKANESSLKNNPRVEVVVLAERVEDLAGTPEERAERIQTEERPTSAKPEEHAEENHDNEKESHPVDASTKPEHAEHGADTRPVTSPDAKHSKKLKGQAFARPLPFDQSS